MVMVIDFIPLVTVIVPVAEGRPVCLAKTTSEIPEK
jgi:hypothetical protein